MGELFTRIVRTVKKLRWPLGIAVLGYLILTYLPIFPHQPFCRADGSTVSTVSGPLSRDYRIALMDNLALYERDFVTIGDRVLLRFYDWWDPEDWVLNAAAKAVVRVVATRELIKSGGGTDEDLRRKRDEARKLRYDCAVVRAVAIKHPAEP